MSSDNSFENILSDKVKYIEDIIREYAPKSDRYEKTVCDAMNYSLLSGGKRLRPMLMYETYNLFHGTSEAIYPFMAALEMIHTYSLIHDDLPAMDNDRYRRGRETNWVVYGEDMAILAGDALLNYAYETALRSSKCCKTLEEYQRMIHAMEVLSIKAGIYGMVGGQVTDVLSEGKQIDKDTMDYIHKNKTAALIECAMMTGAILAGADDKNVKQVENIANAVGMAFQIQDDILDVTGNFDELGKPIHSDEKNSKSTYVTLFGLEGAKEKVLTYSQNAMEALNKLPGQNEFLENLIESLIHRKK